MTGYISKVIVEAHDFMWRVRMLDDAGNTKMDDTGQPEISYPHPGNKGKTITEGKRLAKFHGVNGYLRMPQGHTTIYLHAQHKEEA